MLTRAQIAILLSKLDVFSDPDPMKEQYPTDSETASQILWNGFMLGDIKNKIVADFGCGTGVLGIGALLLEAKWVFFVDIDRKALEIARGNYERLRGEFNLGSNVTFVDSDISEFKKEVETVIMNPPFGVQKEHADRVFLERGFALSKVIYDIHKIESKDFIEKYSGEHGFRVTHLFRYNLALKKTMLYHTHRIDRVAVGCFRLEKKE